MPEIEFSAMIHTPATEAFLRSLLAEFEALSGIHVRLTLLNWEEGKSELIKTANYHHGPDISEIGSTWVNDLVAMDALRPFSQNELALIGKPESFLAESWKSGQTLGRPNQWALPWLAETYIIHYRRDLLAQAGISEASAFASHEAIARTAAGLQAAGAPVAYEPLLELDSFGTLHCLASWIWTAGGRFCSPDGQQVHFNRPTELQAIYEYFSLLHNLSPAARRQIRERRSSLFVPGEAAMTFGTLRFYTNYFSAPPHVQQNWGIAPLPGAHFMGGSNLVIWQHAGNERAALELARFLTGSAIQVRCALALAALPTRLAALENSQIAGDPALSIFAAALRSGRSYRSIPLWGLVEGRLSSALLRIGRAILADEAPDLRLAIRRQLEPLARRLNLTLAPPENDPLDEE